MPWVALGLLLTILLVVGGFTVVVVSTFVSARVRERRDYYRAEMFRRALERGASTQVLLELERHESAVALRRTRDGVRLGGVMAAAAGLAMVLALPAGTFGVLGRLGWIPLAVGVAMLACAQWMRVPPAPAAPAGTASE